MTNKKLLEIQWRDKPLRFSGHLARWQISKDTGVLKLTSSRGTKAKLIAYKPKKETPQ